MLQPSAITSLLSQLIKDPPSSTTGETSIRPHTALLTLLESSELYASATRLVDAPPPTRSAVASILASTAAAAGTHPPVPTYNGKAPLTLDERAVCLSAIAVTGWREVAEGSAQRGNVVVAGEVVKVRRHAVTGFAGEEREVVPLLLDSDLGRILVMPITAATPTSASRGEMAMDESQDEAGFGLGDKNRPFMLLTLNAAADPPRSQPTPQNTLSSALASSTATLSAAGTNAAARSRLKSGVTTPTSTRSDRTPTTSRSPVSDHFPVGSTSGPPQHGGTSPASGDVEQAAASAVEQDAEEAKIWSSLYAQAKALARVLAPSLTKCGVGQHHDDDHEGGRQSGMVSDDEVDS
ncbi:hypothetical protein PHBOTO_004229 [Pseudozyma hubeiensis]|nr:hypothetical protein PHBOTO_004229 [Pseudozyma hubeiensis]